ncbi:site-specific DNA-methyltransferase [bacterium]|nr:site-specific DNA-methyltransferase [bacterium]
MIKDSEIELKFDHVLSSSQDKILIGNNSFQKFTGEFWTPRQRQAHSLHEIAYRACFKPQLPKFFIESLTQTGDIVYDPFSGRGTTALEAALLRRRVIANDINPLSVLLTGPRLSPPTLEQIEQRLSEISFEKKAHADIDLSMFFHPKTETEIVLLKKYFLKRISSGQEDDSDRWIRMVATNRLTGHSSGFFSVYTLPPNQAVTPADQKRINAKRKQKPDYRDTKKIILKKSRILLRDVSNEQREHLRVIREKAIFLTNDARQTDSISGNSVQLTVTSPPFLDVVQYASDNWLRCWFNGINSETIRISTARSVTEWETIMQDVFYELYRITKPGGHVAFEVGEVRNGKIRLDEHVVPLGIHAGFFCKGVLINEQRFTKTANIWGVGNNRKGTNTNRIVLFSK